MDVAHAILFAKAIDISRVTADYSSAKFESFLFCGSSLFDMGRRKEQMFFIFVQSFTNGQIMGFGC